MLEDKYIKTIKREEDEAKKFLGLNKKTEDKVKSNIEKCYENIIINYINEKISNCQKIKLEEKNKKNLILFIKNIIKNLSPSFRDLKDSMNINDYIKVKILKYKDFSLSRVIDGFAMTKNVCSKRMYEKKEDPKILLLDLDLNEHITKELIKINNGEKVESLKMIDIKKKIQLLGVDVILLNKGIGNKVLETILKGLKIIIIINVKSSALKKIARCTKGEVISSFRDINIEVDDNNKVKFVPKILGTCKLFQTINVNNFKKEKKRNKRLIINDFSSYNNSNFDNIILSNNHKLMIFEGCNSLLFQTLLLSGTNKEGLSEIKKLLKTEIFSTCREYFLQKTLLYFLFCNIPPFIKDKDKEKDKDKDKDKQIIKNTNTNKDIITNDTLSLTRGASNEIKIPNVLVDEKIKRNSLKLENGLSEEVINNFKNNDFIIKENDFNIERKASETSEKNKKLNNQKNNNNISIISNNSFINKDLKNNNQNISKLNSILNNNLNNNLNNQNDKVHISKSKERNIKRNLSNMTNNFILTKTNKEKISYHSYSNAKKPSKGLFKKSNLRNNNISTFKTYEQEVQIFEEPSTLDTQGINHIDIKKIHADIDRHNLNLISTKFLSNKSIIKINEPEEKNNDIQIQWKDVDDSPKSESEPRTETSKNNNNSYKYGFDISPILTNKTCLKFMKLKMCKGESKLINTSNTLTSENSHRIRYKYSQNDMSITENSLLKSLNIICENMQEVSLVYYKSKYNEKDKILVKMIIDKIEEKDKLISKMILDMIEEKDLSLSKKIIDIIKEKDKYLVKVIIDLIEEKDKPLGKMIIDMIEENDKNLVKVVMDLIEEKNKLSGKLIIDIIEAKDKALGKMVIDIIGVRKDISLGNAIINILEDKNNPLNRKIIYKLEEKDKILYKKIIDILEEKDKVLGKMIIDIIEEKERILDQLIIDVMEEKDKPLGKMIIDMIAEKDKKCNKCKNIMLNHFYYLYNSHFSRIKIDYISNSDSNLEKVIDFINRESVDFKKYYFDNIQVQELDYNIDIFSYGFCKECKQIVTPLIKMPKDLFNYSSAKFFNHIFNNKDICNRSDASEFNLTSFIKKKKCNHSSFHNINRIFVTRFGALKFQYEDLRKYDLISVQKIPDIKNLKIYSSKEINSYECLKIINLLKENIIYELREMENIEKIIKKNNITIFNYFNKNDYCVPVNIIESTINLLKSLIEYLKEESEDNSSNYSSKNMPDMTDNDNSNIENENIEKKVKLSQITSKSKNVSYGNSIDTEELNRKDASKSPNLTDKEKNNFPNIINSLYSKKFEDLKKVGLIKRIFFKIVQMKVLYNEIRTVINRIKIYISLDFILRDEESKNKSNVIKTNEINNNPSFILDKNKNKIENDIKDRSNNECKEEKTFIDTDSIKSKTPKIPIKTADKIISNHKFENNTKNIFGPLDLENDGSAQLDQSNNTNNGNFNNNNVVNNNNVNNENLEEKSPFELDPKKKYFLKSNSENILYGLDLKEEKNNINKEQNLNTENEEKIELSPDTIIKLLIDKYASIFDSKQEYNNINENEDYTKILKIIRFYDDQPNDFSSIIKETDLSSIVSYAISSSQYKTFIKEKTNLLDIKRIQQPKESDKNPPKLNLMEMPKKENNNILNKSIENNNLKKNNKESQQSNKKDDLFLYDTLLLFDSSNINYAIVNSDLKSNNAAKKKKINRMLEAEILCKDNNHFVINISSLNRNKFKCRLNASRKMTISRQTMSNQIASPVLFSPKPSESEKSYFQIESDLEQIEEKLRKFYSELESVNREIGNINKRNKIENFLKPLDVSNNPNLLNNINLEELYAQNNNNTNNNLDQKKKELLVNFTKSLNYSKYIKKEPTQIFSEKTNLIDIIGKLYFSEDLLSQTEIEVIIYYPRQFEALRIAYCCTYEDLVMSITKSNAWTDVSGGKSKASFYKTSDEKYLFKSINKNEFNMFLEIAFYYFQHIDEYLFHEMPSVLMKILGVYKIRIKKTENGETIIENYYLMMMENLNYGFNVNKEKIKSYDLKGSTINRYIKKKERKEKDNLVLLDSNFKEDYNNEPIPLEKDLYGLLLVSVYNDTLFLSKMGIVDYSLLLYINDKSNNRKNKDNLKHSLIRVGIIDYIRRYTWDKKLEHFVKTIINGFNSPTIINPKDYKERFIAAIKSYFIGI